MIDNNQDSDNETDNENSDNENSDNENSDNENSDFEEFGDNIEEQSKIFQNDEKEKVNNEKFKVKVEPKKQQKGGNDLFIEELDLESINIF